MHAVLAECVSRDGSSFTNTLCLSVNPQALGSQHHIGENFILTRHICHCADVIDSTGCMTENIMRLLWGPLGVQSADGMNHRYEYNWNTMNESCERAYTGNNGSK